MITAPSEWPRCPEMTMRNERGRVAVGATGARVWEGWRSVCREER